MHGGNGLVVLQMAEVNELATAFPVLDHGTEPFLLLVADPFAGEDIRYVHTNGNHY